MAVRSQAIWSESARDKDGNLLCIYDVAFQADGSKVLVAAGNAILVYEVEGGRLEQTLRAHKDTIHSLSFNRDGSKFASGSADKFVIIWNNSNFSGELKYSHSDSVQCVAFNPASSVILSCSISDIGLWSTEGSQKSVSKHKITSRACCCSWTSDGQYFSLGHYNGCITIWSKVGEEKIKISRPGGHPVWAMSWNPSRDDRYDALSVCDWGQRLSFYQLNGKQAYKERNLGFDACFYNFFGGGEYAITGGSNKKALLYTREGVHLSQLGEEQESWVWCCRSQPGDKGHAVILGCQNGTISFYQLGFSTVHGLYKDRYAYRDNLTDVVVQSMLNEETVTLKCRELVKKISVYKNKMAIQLPSKILLFEFTFDGDMSYTIKDKINKKVECSLMVACSENIILCMEKKLQCLSMSGEVEREWPLESQIRYIKVVGGPSGRESLLAGLKNGQVLKIFIDNLFPVHLLQIQTVIRCLDLNSSRTKLAIVDENNVLTVYDLRTKALLYQEPNASSVSWNTHYEDMLCFSCNGTLNIKTSTFPAHQHKQHTGQGFVVGFTGSKIFSLQYYNMVATDVPLSAPMVQYLERKMFKEAYKVACLGVTDTDWKTLALEALEGMDFEIAKKAFIRVRDLRFLELIRSIEERKQQGENNIMLFLADIFAYQGKFQEAAKMYRNAGDSQKAVDMFTELRQFDLAKEYMKFKDQDDMTKLITQQADWAKITNDPESACNMYLAAGQYEKAIDIMGDNSWTYRIVDLYNELPNTEREALKHCAHHLKRLGEYNYAGEVYEKMGDYSALAMLHVETQQWERAFELVENKPELKDLVYLPYATWLVENDRFDEAQEALTRAGKRSEAVQFLQQLANNAINEARYEDAGYYHWLLARAHLDEARREDDQEGSEMSSDDLVSKFHNHITLAEVYHVYHSIHRFINQPFTSLLAEALFNMSRFLLHKMMADAPKGVSQFATLFTLAKQSRNMGAYKMARYAYDKMQSLKVPSQFQDAVDLGCLTIRSKPFQDKEELLPLCYRCSTTNPLLNTAGSFCINCHQPFVFSFVSFEVLPLVEFTLEEDISDEEALKLIKADPPNHKKGKQWKETRDGDVDVLQFDESSNDSDPFNEKSVTELGSYAPVTVNRATLRSLHRREVIVKRWSPPLRYQYYRSLLPDVQVKLCNSCNQMFHADDYELQVSCKGNCPFCRQSVNTSIN